MQSGLSRDGLNCRIWERSPGDVKHRIHGSIANEFNTLLIKLHDGHMLEINVNGQAITAPIKFDPPLGSVVPGLAFWQRNANEQATVRAEFTRFTVWLK